MKLTLFRSALVIALLLGFSVSAIAQKGKGKTTPAEAPAATEAPKANPNADAIQRYRQIYNTSLNYNDFAVATEAMYHLIALQPNDAALKDTLAALYFQRAAWPQTVLVTTEVLAANPGNQAALELRAVANQSMGRAKESLDDYEALYKLGASPFHLYEIAALQFSMKRFGECEASVKRLLADSGLKDKTISISVQDGRTQEVPLYAAAFNLNGVLDLELGKKDSAKGHFENALKLYPEFILAKNNLDALLQMK